MLKVPARFYRLFLESRPYGCNEKDFHYVEQDLEIPVGEAALVLVDLWNKHYCTSWNERATDVVLNKIVPVVEAARLAGLAVIQAPGQRIAERYPQSAGDFEPGDGERAPIYASVDPDWPPASFVARTEGFLPFKREYSAPFESWENEYRDQGMSEHVAPRPEDWIVRSGAHLHKVLKKLGVLHLFFAGFATNMCLQHRDYGMRAMFERGYNPILIRDCTTAIETHDTVDGLLSTRVSVQEIEMKYAFSITSDQFTQACQVASRGNPP
jgi:nicotinamidase-related amidase